MATQKQKYLSHTKLARRRRRLKLAVLVEFTLLPIIASSSRSKRIRKKTPTLTLTPRDRVESNRGRKSACVWAEPTQCLHTEARNWNWQPFALRLASDEKVDYFSLTRVQFFFFFNCVLVKTKWAHKLRPLNLASRWLFERASEAFAESYILAKSPRL